MPDLDFEWEVGLSCPVRKDWIIDGVEGNDLIVNFFAGGVAACR